jgi:rSAM/selenodomain-associated transferase 2
MVNNALTVLIPTLNEAGTLAACLTALAPGAALIREIIIIDAGSADATTSLAAGWPNTRVITTELGSIPGRGGQIRAGIAAAATEWLLVLHADTILSPNWPQAVTPAITQFAPDATPDAAHYFRFRLGSAHPAARLIEAMVALRCQLFALPYGDQGLLIAKSLLAQIGGMPDLPLMEDVALARALKRRLRPLDATATTSARRYERGGWVRRPLRNLACLTLYLCGVAPETIRKFYD